MSQDILRLIDGICREKSIDRDSFIEDLKIAIEAALRRRYEDAEIVEVAFDPIAGNISATVVSFNSSTASRPPATCSTIEFVARSSKASFRDV